MSNKEANTPRELDSKNPAQLARTLVRKNGSTYVVSTIELTSEIRQMDDLIGMTFDLATGGQSGDEEMDERFGFLNEAGGYETMVFSCNDKGEVQDWQESDRFRWEDKNAALAGHKDTVEKWSKGEELS